MIRDSEDLLESIRTYLKTNLNTYINSINAEKLADDSTTFQNNTITANNDRYLTAVNIEDLPNRTFVLIGLNSPFEIETNVNDYSIDLSIQIEVVFQKPHNKNNGYIAFRYMRALLETMLAYESSTDEVEGLQITGGIPMEVTDQTQKYITAGITVSIKLA